MAFEGGGTQHIDLTRDQKQSRQMDELAKLQAQQQNGELEMVGGNRNSKYDVRQIEADNYVHVAVKNRHYDEANNRMQEDSRIVKVHNRDFDRMVNSGAFNVYSEVEVIHDARKDAPKKYNLKPQFVTESMKDQTPQDAVNKLGDKNVGLREQELAKREQELDNRIASLEARENIGGVSFNDDDVNKNNLDPQAIKKQTGSVTPNKPR